LLAQNKYYAILIIYMIDLNTKIEQLGRVGKVTAGRLKKLGISIASDLIYYFPFRYDDFSKILRINQLSEGIVATVAGTIDMIESRRSWRRRKLITEAVVSDATGTIKVIWFNQRFLTKTLKPGDEIYLSGKVSYEYFQLQFSNPMYEKKIGENIHTGRLVPIYPLTESLTQRQLRFLIKQVMPLTYEITDWLPAETIKRQKLGDLGWSLRQIHFPESQIKLNQSLQRLKFDELLILQLQINLTKKEFQKLVAPKLEFFQSLTKKFVCSLPFSLTADQKKSAWQILKDLEKGQPMNRLLEGDVGSGKTVVVAIAAANAIANGWQVVFMAPTEILAQQHYETLNRLFVDFKPKIGLLTHNISLLNNKKIPKKEFANLIKNQKVDLLIGTHALIVKDSFKKNKIVFKKLGLAIIDEQHRFGVAQRQALKDLYSGQNLSPHFLSLSATPIPRSLFLIFYGDLSLSTIKELPRGRQKIITRIVKPNGRQEVYDFIRREINDGRQVYVICPLIDPSDKLGVRSVTAEYDILKKEIFPDLAVDFLHGKLKGEAKNKKMQDFKNNHTKILISTTVVEVGVDVPNSTIMVIEGAERFGLAQLYQLRGRIGRSTMQSYCFLFTNSGNIAVEKRLQSLIDAKDCFELAEADLALRGPGELFGTQQSGFLDLKVATLHDIAIATAASEETNLLTADENIFEKNPEFKNKIDSVIKEVHLE